MKQYSTILGVFLSVLVICPVRVSAKTIEVRLQIRNDKSDENIVKRENLVKIKEFILQQGKRETYCNMYNNNPAYHTTHYHFYLNPDTGQQNIECDPTKSDFQKMTIHVLAAVGKPNQYRDVNFVDKNEISITSAWPTDNLTVADVRGTVVDALREILAEIKKAKPMMEIDSVAKPVVPLDNFAKTLFISSHYKGESYESCLTPQQFDAMPSWDPTGDKPIPVDPGRAVRLARATFERRVPEAEHRNWVLARVELLQKGESRPSGGYVEAGAQKWYYVVHFWNKMNPTVAAFPTPAAIREKQDEFNIIVLLSGEVCEPVARPRK